VRLLALCCLLTAAQAQEAELRAALELPRKSDRRAMVAPLAALPIETLREAIARLAPDRDVARGVATATVALHVEGATEETRITTYVPERYRPEEPAPLLLALHGAGGDGLHEHARWRDVADDLGMIVLSPSEAGGNEGYGFTSRERASALAALRWARLRYRIDPDRIHVTGISRGGHLAWDLALRHPDLFASLAPMVGGPRLDTRGGQNNLRFIENVAHLPIRDLQGEGDDPRMLFNLRLAFERLAALGAQEAHLLTFPGLAHSFDLAAVDWRKLFASARRDPLPPRVVRLCARVGEGRAFYVEILKLDSGVREEFTPQVRAEVWNALDDAGRRRHIAAAAEQNAARIEVASGGGGRFDVESRGVARFRLLLEPGMFDVGTPVRIMWNGRSIARRPVPSARTLLDEYVERVDPRFLPVAELVVP